MTANTVSRLEALKKVWPPDCVHFVASGYDNLVTNIIKSEALRADSPAEGLVSKKQHYWRRSTVGSITVSGSTAGGAGAGGLAGRMPRAGRPHRSFLPYRWGKWKLSIICLLTKLNVNIKYQQECNRNAALNFHVVFFFTTKLLSVTVYCLVSSFSIFSYMIRRSKNIYQIGYRKTHLAIIKHWTLFYVVRWDSYQGGTLSSYSHWP